MSGGGAVPQNAAGGSKGNAQVVNTGQLNGQSYGGTNVGGMLTGGGLAAGLMVPADQSDVAIAGARGTLHLLFRPTKRPKTFFSILLTLFKA